MSHKRLLIIAHAPSHNTQLLRDALLAGARAPDIGDVAARALSPFETGPEDVFAADAILLLTPENLGYMSGALKDFFDRCYYPCLERTQGRPYALAVRAGSDGTGALRGVQTIVTGLRWRAIQDPLVCRGDWRPEFAEQCRELGMLMAAGLDAGVF
ncbi:MAG: flavodoxin family protein [Methylocystis sp.]|uniref:flavodoxin family protein n=1 Tax=Methylocystis sp. TaxID=1911079 RepID=UPI003DA5B506